MRVVAVDGLDPLPAEQVHRPAQLFGHLLHLQHLSLAHVREEVPYAPGNGGTALQPCLDGFQEERPVQVVRLSLQHEHPPTGVARNQEVQGASRHVPPRGRDDHPSARHVPHPDCPDGPVPGHVRGGQGGGGGVEGNDVGVVRSVHRQEVTNHLGLCPEALRR